MKSRTSLLIALLFMAIIFAACGPASESDRTPGVTEPALTDDGFLMETITNTQETITTEDMTEPALTEPPITEMTTAPQATEAITEVVPPTGSVDPNRLTNLLDFPVFNKDGDQIGEVGNMILNPQTQQVDYVILELGGFLGLGETQIVVPWQALWIVVADSPDRDDDANDNDNAGNIGDLQNAIVLMADQETVDNAPEIDLNTFANFCGTSIGWDVELQTYWAFLIPMDGDETETRTETPEVETPESPDATGTPAVIGTPVSGTPSVDEAPSTGGLNVQGAILATNLLGANINLQDNPEQAGTVDDVMVDIDTGKIRFLVVTFGFDDTESRLPLPAALLGCDADNETFVVLIDTETVRTAPTFSDNEFPDTRTDDWDASFLDYWSDFVDMDMDTETD